MPALIQSCLETGEWPCHRGTQPHQEEETRAPTCTQHYRDTGPAGNSGRRGLGGLPGGNSYLKGDRGRQRKEKAFVTEGDELCGSRKKKDGSGAPQELSLAKV